MLQKPRMQRHEEGKGNPTDLFQQLVLCCKAGNESLLPSEEGEVVELFHKPPAAVVVVADHNNIKKTPLKSPNKMPNKDKNKASYILLEKLVTSQIEKQWTSKWEEQTFLSILDSSCFKIAVRKLVKDLIRKETDDLMERIVMLEKTIRTYYNLASSSTDDDPSSTANDDKNILATNTTYKISEFDQQDNNDNN